ncbi:hypothetical protein E8E14_007743 [Neopestalotiopsis sp. 37M]|nr:hypothetical protein E8E14_007743 [Neopestalotiopsis sp. 37M]
MDPNRPSTWLPGMTFNFSAAISVVYQGLRFSQFKMDDFYPLLRSIIQDWLNGYCRLSVIRFDDQAEYSLMSIHVLFLKTLWRELYGLHGGQHSPWESLCPTHYEHNAVSDKMLVMKPLFEHLLWVCKDQSDFIRTLSSGRIPGSNQTPATRGRTITFNHALGLSPFNVDAEDIFDDDFFVPNPADITSTEEDQ